MKEQGVEISSTRSIIEDARNGKMFILVDHEDRENEGDLVITGSKCNSRIINFMAKNGRGLTGKRSRIPGPLT